MKVSLFQALAACAVLCLAPAASAQTAPGPASFSTGYRPGGDIVGSTGTTWSWTIPAGQYVAVARISYALQSLGTTDGGGVSRIRCRLHRATGGNIDAAMASIGAGPNNGNSVAGVLTLTGRVSVPTGGPLSITCDASGAHARSTQRVDTTRVELIQVSSMTNLAIAP